MHIHLRIRRTYRNLLLAVAAFAACLIFAGRARTQNQTDTPVDRDAVLSHLNSIITWYRDVRGKVQPTGLPSDAIYQDHAESLAAQAVRLAFQSARAVAKLDDNDDKPPSTPAPTKPAGGKKASKDAARSDTGKSKADGSTKEKQKGSARQNESTGANGANAASGSADTSPSQAPATGQPGSPNRRQNLAQTMARVSAQIDDAEQKLESVNKALAAAPASKRAALIAQRDALQGQLSLNKAMLDTMQKMSNFLEGSAEGGEGLEGSIEQLARSVPEVLATDGSKKPTPQPASTPTLSNSSGLIGQSLTLFGQMRSIHDIDQITSETDHVRESVDRLRKPIRDSLVATMQRGRELAAQSSDGNAAQSQESAREYQALTAKFKVLSGATLPLGQELVVIDQAHSNFTEWRKSILEESKYTLRALATRIIGIALALAAVFALSEVWRRLTFRYIHDPRRRRQFLVMRRFVMGFLIGVVLLMGFVSEFSSLATFAGFVTAGIAVGLQAVLLSIAAYFFVIGRYGIRVGDRISVAGVTGDVIDIGLVRLYLMELAGTGIDLYPTGRVVMFSNSVLFQAGTPLFKQIPGTEYAWHEVVVPLAPGSNYKLVQEKLSGGVHHVYEKYRPGIEGQMGSIERRLEVQLKAPVPEAKLQFADSGLEFVVRYPVDIRRASEIDDQVTRTVLNLLDQDGELKTTVAGTPKIRAAIKG
jgi:small-conductance mechanosensitive channel